MITKFSKVSGGDIELDPDVAWADDNEIYKEKKGDDRWIPEEHIQRFRVWIRIAGLPTFRKHWYIIKDGLESGDYNVEIDANYDVSKFDGEKYIVLSTTNAFGGKNHILGWFLIGTGIISAGLCIVFLLGYMRNQTKDTSVYVSSS